MAILSLPLTAHLTTLHCLPKRSEGPGLLAVALRQTKPLTIVILSGAKDLAVMSLYCLDSTKETHHPNLDILFDQFPMFALQTDRFKIVVCEGKRCQAG